MTTEKAIYQLTDLIKDRESFCHRDDFDDMFLQDIEACKAGIQALEKQVLKKPIVKLSYICEKNTIVPNVSIIYVPIVTQKNLTVPTAVRLWIGVMKMVELKRKQCFVNYHCSSDCPNAEYEMADDRYGFGIADDMGLEKVSCKQCRYNTGRCEDCLFEHSKDCPEYKESKEDVE